MTRLETDLRENEGDEQLRSANPRLLPVEESSQLTVQHNVKDALSEDRVPVSSTSLPEVAKK